MNKGITTVYYLSYMDALYQPSEYSTHTHMVEWRETERGYRIPKTVYHQLEEFQHLLDCYADSSAQTELVSFFFFPRIKLEEFPIPLSFFYVVMVAGLEQNLYGRVMISWNTR